MAIRSEESRRAVLEATMKLLEDSGPAGLTVQKLSIERIAREAGVSKTTIYRWWSSKVAVVIDTFLDNHVARTPVRQDVPAIDALREHMASLAEVYAGNEGRLVAQLLGECQQDEAAMAEFKRHFWIPRAQVVTSLVERAIGEGSLRKDLDAQVVTEMLYAPVYFRLLFQSGPLDAKATDAIMQTAFEGLAAG
jgi:AcrR family transcriptional regulator